MSRNLTEVLHGGDNGAGIKGIWDCTPVVSSLAVTSAVNATFDPVTNTATTDWSTQTFAASTPFYGAVALNATFGTLNVNEVRKLAASISSTFLTATSLSAAFVGFFPPGSTAADMITAGQAFMTNPSAVPTPVVTLIALGESGGNLFIEGVMKLVDDVNTTGIANSSVLSGVGLDNTTLEGFYITRKQPVNPGPTQVEIAAAAFTSAGATVNIGAIGTATNNPVISPDAVLGVLFIFVGTGTGFDTLSATLKLNDAPDHLVVPA